MHMGYTNNAPQYSGGVVIAESKTGWIPFRPNPSRHHWKFYGATAVNGSAKNPKEYFLDLISIITIIVVSS